VTDRAVQPEAPTLDALWYELLAQACSSDGPIRDNDVKQAIAFYRPKIEAEARAASQPLAQERPQPNSIDAEWSDAVDRYMPSQERPCGTCESGRICATHPRAASQERPQPIHVKHDDWWCECGSRVEDCDYLQENLRAQERPSIDVDALRLAAEALSEALLPTTGGYHTPAEPVQALRRILRSVASPEPRDE
jgi:hypothetical protein